MSENTSQDGIGDFEIVIRSAYQTEDLKITSSPDWTVLRLKERISELSPSHPDVTSQRLIFSGRVLLNDALLKNVIQNGSVVEGAQVIHLVSTQPYRQTASENVRRRNVASNSTTPTVPTRPQRNLAYAAAPPARVPWTEWQRMWPEVVNGTANSEQIQAYNQYVQNYYHQYQLYQESQYAFSQIAGMPLNGTEGHFHFVVQNYNVQENAAAPNVPFVRRFGEGIRAGFAGVDFLDVVYKFFKVVLFCSALILYSTFERFVLVLMAALFLYFIQLRRNQVRLRMRGEQVEEQQRNDQQAQNVDGAAQGNGPESEESQAERVNNNNAGESEAERNNDTNENAQAPANGETPPSGVSVFLACVYSFVTSFFASLVPDHPPVDMN